MVKGKKASPKKVMVVVAVLTLTMFIAVGCGGAPRPASENPDNSSKKGDSIAVEWSMQSDCATCHTQQKESQEKSGTQANVHANTAKASCTSCHTDEASLKKAHEGKASAEKKPTKLMKSNVSREACQASGCHDLADADFAALTASVNTFVDATGKQANPHQVVTQVGHEEMMCSNCHTEHEDKPVADMKYCVTCHHSGNFDRCVTCHG